ncbi:unnamed protein product [Spirodela intermedia]|uniref:C3HC-type domain-containing protein n=1 Tax=Spirodela intermedia TaxID=51605 RepID=A0A7I8JSF3_SPIIN|nr:unnamed protein product [Spirodela intermedia]CAA6673110.1 unnamed protein product [Spirodela intermedia]
MAEDTERRLKRVMDKLYHSPRRSLQLRGTPAETLGKFFGMGASTPLKRRRWELGSNVEAARSVRRATGEDGRSPCRPWDRGDLMRRLATFKAMTWFGKPKRGWVNVQMDTLACQSCGARLLFSNPSSWTLQQVEKAAAVFSLNLDGGHKLLCPWIDNISLIESYKERSTALLRLSALPVISSTVIDFMKCPQLDNFLSQPTTFTYRLDGGMKLISSSESLAHKIISLCGWEPRLVPYVVDYGHESKQSFKRDKNLASVTSSSAIFRERDDERCDHRAAGTLMIQHCSIRVQTLWSMCWIIFNLIESPEDGQNDLAACGSEFNPTPESIKFKISLPIVARHFRAAFEKDVEINSHVSKAQAMDQSYTQSPLENQEAIRPHLNGDVSLTHEEGHEQSSANTHEFLDNPSNREANIFQQDGDDFPGMDAQIHGTTPQSITPDSSVDACLNGRDGVHVAGAMETDAPQPPVDRSTESQVAAQRTPHQISVLMMMWLLSGTNQSGLSAGDANKFDPIRHHRPFSDSEALSKDESSPLAKPPPLPPPPCLTSWGSSSALLLPIFEEIKRVIQVDGCSVFFSLDAASTERGLSRPR